MADFGDISAVSEAVLKKGWEECADVLGGQWGTVSRKEIVIKPITGGLSNYLYLCSLPDHIETTNGEPRHVLLRIYGQILLDNPDSMVLDSVIFALMSEKKLGPKLYGVFAGGRMEEYIPARCLFTKELHLSHISRECAMRMARIHQLHMPLCKEPRFIWDTMDRWQNEILHDVTFDAKDTDSHTKFNKFLAHDIEKEYKWLRETLSKVHSPVVFCHNDMQEGNILYMEEQEKGNQLLAIDFEYAGYNYRGFDIGNHFCEWMYCYRENDPPYYKANLDDYPSRERQLEFIRAYLAESGDSNNNTDTEEAMLLEINSFAMASHLFWAYWSVVQTRISHIQFGYMDYALRRMDDYFWLKQNRKSFGRVELSET